MDIIIGHVIVWLNGFYERFEAWFTEKFGVL